MLKPRVVFHGGSVPAHVAEEAASAAKEAEAVLVVGSTASTFSAFRLVRDAHKKGADVGIIGFGPTRVDEFAKVKVEGSAGDVLSLLAQRADEQRSGEGTAERGSGGEGGDTKRERTVSLR